MTERHQINSWEFDMWLDEFSADILENNTRERLYDMWVEGYGTWEVETILG